MAAPKQHVLRLAIERHKNRLSSELIRARINAGHPTLLSWRNALSLSGLDSLEGTSEELRAHARYPRWVRINTLHTSFDSEPQQTFGDHQRKGLIDILAAKPGLRVFAVDEHIPDLIALPEGSQLSKEPSYLKGRVILQDKASCFPAYLLDPRLEDGDIIDTCAAPGNKTTHLAALLHSARQGQDAAEFQPKRIILACERDKARSEALQRMVTKAGANKNDLVKCLPKQDFTKLDPHDSRFKNVGALLLDPSCSGSGMIGRDESDAASTPPLVLPRSHEEMANANAPGGKKRKRSSLISEKEKPDRTKAPQLASSPTAEIDATPTMPTHKPLADRLAALSHFQLSLLKHAFAFPAAGKVVYSTCSIHADENEHVVLRALASDVAKEKGWRVCRRDEQVDGMRRWKIRGDLEAVRDYGRKYCEGLAKARAKEIAEACLRCEKGTEEGTMGFFAVKFMRDTGVAISEGTTDQDQASEGEWQGFSDEET